MLYLVILTHTLAHSVLSHCEKINHAIRDPTAPIMSPYLPPPRGMPETSFSAPFFFQFSGKSFFFGYFVLFCFVFAYSLVCLCLSKGIRLLRALLETVVSSVGLVQLQSPSRGRAFLNQKGMFRWYMGGVWVVPCR